MGVLVVIPTFNEVATISEAIERVRAAVPSASVLVVDDGSPDGTADVAEKMSKFSSPVEVLRRTRKSGLGDAYRAGFTWGLERGFDVLVEMDADLSHDPAAIPSLLAPLGEHDLVIGSRYVPGGSVPRWAAYRRLLSWGGNHYSALMLGMPVRDLTSGFRAYRSEVLRRIRLESVHADGYGFQIEMAYRVSRSGGRIKEIPIRFVDRGEGESKMSSAIAAEALVLVTRWGLQRVIGRSRTDEVAPAGDEMAAFPK